ncbi:MAG: hypothetical protein ACLFNU_06255 [Bacteroidales bacterium]
MKINRENIKLLLEKYYQGESTLKEEALLKDYFSKNEVNEDLHADMQLFLSLNDESENDLNISFEEEVQKAIYSSGEKRKSRRFINYRLITTWAATAAVILLIIGVGWLTTSKSTESVFVDTYDDPKVAMQETQKILALVGSKINRAQEELEPLHHLDAPFNAAKKAGSLSQNLEYLNLLQIIDKPKQVPLLNHIFEREKKSKDNNK